MTLKTTSFILFSIILINVSLLSCKKNNSETTDKSDTSVAADNSLVEGIYNDIQNISDQASNGDLKFYSPLQNGNKKDLEIEAFEKSSCATITHDSISNPKTLVVNFGNTNCLCQDGKNRRGTINVSYTGKYRESGSVRTITFSDYFVNDNQVLGTKTVTNNGLNANGHTTFTIVVDGKIIKANGAGTHTWTSNRKREWLIGENTKTWIDDVYSITGSSSGTSANGSTYTATITTALRRALNCNWFDSGVIELNQTGKLLKTINYGNGSCDSDATVLINGKTYPITLK